MSMVMDLLFEELEAVQGNQGAIVSGIAVSVPSRNRDMEIVATTPHTGSTAIFDSSADNRSQPLNQASLQRRLLVFCHIPIFVGWVTSLS